jgi:hypothetical protein
MVHWEWVSKAHNLLAAKRSDLVPVSDSDRARNFAVDLDTLATFGRFVIPISKAVFHRADDGRSVPPQGTSDRSVLQGTRRGSLLHWRPVSPTLES